MAVVHIGAVKGNDVMHLSLHRLTDGFNTKNLWDGVQGKKWISSKKGVILTYITVPIGTHAVINGYRQCSIRIYQMTCLASWDQYCSWEPTICSKLEVKYLRFENPILTLLITVYFLSVW